VSYELACGSIPANHVVMHTCDNPACVNPEHLRLGSQLDNIADMKLKGRASRLPKAPGERNGNSTLTSETIRDIRSKYDTGLYTLRELGEEFGTHLSNVSLIVRGKTWGCGSEE
jgi:hypothetical protein